MAPSESWPPEGRPPAPRVVPLWLAGLGAATAFLLPVAFFSGFLLGRWQPSASPVLARESSAELPAVSAAPPPAAAERARPDERPPSPSPEPSTSAAAAASRPEDPAPGDAEPGAELDFASRAAAAIDTLLGRRPTPSASSEVAVVVPGSPPDPAPVSTARRERRRRPSEPPVEDWGAPQLLSVEPPSEGP